MSRFRLLTKNRHSLRKQTVCIMMS